MPKAKPVTINWWQYTGAAIAVIGFLWTVASGWFDLEKRVSWLEKTQMYQHGDVRPFMEEK